MSNQYQAMADALRFASSGCGWLKSVQVGERFHSWAVRLGGVEKNEYIEFSSREAAFDFVDELRKVSEFPLECRYVPGQEME